MNICGSALYTKYINNDRATLLMYGQKNRWGSHAIFSF